MFSFPNFNGGVDPAASLAELLSSVSFGVKRAL